MRGLSISTAWDETKAIVSRDGRLFISVALALVAFPAAISGLISPNGMGDSSAPLWAEILLILVSLIGLAGQLSLIRLALGPSITVGGAIGHGVRRMPIYLVAVIIIIAAFFLLTIPFAVALIAAGVPLERNSVPLSPAVVVAGILYFVLICFAGVRMIMSAPAASAEPTGPIAILKRSWQLTSGHWWQLFGFVLMVFVAAIVVLLAVRSAVGAVAGLLLGPIEPMSASALVVALLQALVNAAITVLFAVMLARIYVQLAGRGEVETSVPTTGT